MFTVRLAELDRTGTRTIRGVIPADDPVWTGPAPELTGPVAVELTVSTTRSGQMVARGSARAPARHRCRRCLDDVSRTHEVDLQLVWTHPDDLDHQDDGELRALDPGASELDLRPAIREELLLAVPAYVVCRADCAGLCPQCGANRNEETCDCTREEADPRWDALRALKDE